MENFQEILSIFRYLSQDLNFLWRISERFLEVLDISGEL